MNAWEEKLLDRQDGYDEGLAEGERKGRQAGLKEGEERGLKTGRKEGYKEIAAKMKAKGMSLEEIVELTGLEASEVEKL